MSWYEYNESQKIASQNYSFYGLLMALIRQADDINLSKLRSLFPHIVVELKDRYNAPGGIIKGDTDYEPR